MVASFEPSRRMALKSLVKVCKNPVFPVIIPAQSTKELRYAQEQECQRFITSSCPYGRWSLTLWATDADRIEGIVTTTYYFEDERDAIYFKMRFS